MDSTFVVSAAFILGVLAVGLLAYEAVFTVPQRSLALVERLGKFVRVREAGLHLRMPFFERVSGRLSLRVQQLDLRLETKSADDVFVTVTVSVLYFVHPERAYDAFYRMQNVTKHITSLVFDSVRARVPSFTLDLLLARKSEVATAIEQDLAHALGVLGYGVQRVLVTEVEPDTHVKQAMNEQHVALRMRLAAVDRGEAERIARVKAAEGDSEAKLVIGRGLAAQRQVTVVGLRAALDELRKGSTAMSMREATDVLWVSDYLEVLAQIASSGHAQTIVLPSMPSAFAAPTSQKREGPSDGDGRRAAEEGSGRTLRHLRTRHDDPPSAPGDGFGEVGNSSARREHRGTP